MAKKPGRVLIVGLNSDASVRKLKGKNRPLNPQRHRTEVLAALACVDYIVTFSSQTPEGLIRALRPDVLIKGADWKGRPIAGSQSVLSQGGKVEFVRYLPGVSTTRLIRDIRKKRGC